MALIRLLMPLGMFGLVSYGVWWACQRLELARPVFWVCFPGLLILVLLYLARGNGISPVWPRR